MPKQDLTKATQMPKLITKLLEVVSVLDFSVSPMAQVLKISGKATQLVATLFTSGSPTSGFFLHPG